MELRDVLTIAFLSLALLTVLITTIGVFKFNDFYTKLHVSGVSGSAGLLFFCAAFLIHEGFNITGIKTFLVSIAAFIGAVVGTHIISRVAFRSCNESNLDRAKQIVDEEKTEEIK